MKNFVFYNPTKIVFGKDTIKMIGNEIREFNVTKTLLLYGKESIFKNGVYDETIRSLKDNGIEFVELSGVKPNPVLSKVREGIEICKKENIDGILAVGGGSVLDSAKVIAAGYYYEGDIWEVFEGKKDADKSLPVFSILTISATGSEMNKFAVVTKEDENKKWSFSAGDSSYPKVSIIDPVVQMSLPKEQTINGAIDAMSHIFELYFDGVSDTDIQDEIAEGLLRTIMKNVKILLQTPDNYEARAQIAWSATLALNGLNAAGRTWGDWSTHTIEHSLSAFYDISHGAGLAIIFPAWMKYVYKNNLPKFVRFAENIFGITEGLAEEKSLKGIECLQNFYSELGAPITLKEIGISEGEIDKLAENAALMEPLGILKKLYKNDIYKIFKLAFE